MQNVNEISHSRLFGGPATQAGKRMGSDATEIGARSQLSAHRADAESLAASIERGDQATARGSTTASAPTKLAAHLEDPGAPSSSRISISGDRGQKLVVVPAAPYWRLRLPPIYPDHSKNSFHPDFPGNSSVRVSAGMPVRCGSVCIGSGCCETEQHDAKERNHRAP